jgi:hypothetical protein
MKVNVILSRYPAGHSLKTYPKSPGWPASSAVRSSMQLGSGPKFPWSTYPHSVHFCIPHRSNGDCWIVFRHLKEIFLFSAPLVRLISAVFEFCIP